MRIAGAIVFALSAYAAMQGWSAFRLF